MNESRRAATEVAALFISLGEEMLMRLVLWCLRILVFLSLLAFALKNTDPVSIRFFPDSAWHAPLIIVVLAFFAGGVLLGVLSLIGTVFSLRRELARLRRMNQGEGRIQEALR
ncbi:MAG: lipopolysaccharide assembly protein LapA domain-containing protein [Propionivibrio sp.]